MISNSKIRDIVITFEFGVILGMFGVVIFYYISEVIGNVMVVAAICIYFAKVLNGKDKESKEEIRNENNTL